ncbi:MAG TPA: pitrilysin family protein [Terriglobales bacterium]|nr:pitrilysin family protein [Terriglobales bacterium]
MRLHTALTVLAIGALGCGLTAQQAAPTNTPDYMTHPPTPGAVKPYAPPTSHADQLPNGLKIVVVEDHRFPLISVRLALRAGTSRLTPDQAGLASAEADLLTEGTPTRTSLQIAQATDAMGGDLSAGAGPDFLTVSGDALSSHAQPLFELLADIVLHPTFPQNEVALEKANLEQSLIASRANGGFLASVEFNKLLYGKHPYAITSPTEASLAKLDRAALVRFHDTYFLPNNQAEVVVTGDINAARAHNLVQQYFGDWKLGRPAPPPSPPVEPPAQRRIYLVERPGSAQSTILLGNLGLTRTAPDYFPFVVVNEVLGGSFNSRLIADIREKKGYTYGISSANQPNRDLGDWIVETEVRTAVTAPALQEIFAQLDQIRAAPVSAQELVQAKNFLSGNFVLGLQTQAEVANQFLTTGIYGLPPDRLATWVDDVEAVTADQAQAAAQQYIHPDKEIVVVVGDVKQIEAGLANLAPGTTMTIFNDKGDVVGSYPPEAPAKVGGNR